MAGYVVVGTQWGDEGKGKIIDVLGSHVDYVVRFQGGNNAGHTVVVNGEKNILHLLPSGVLHTNSNCIIGPGVVVNLQVFLNEIAVLEAKGMKTNHVFISDRAHIIMPYHIQLDILQEESKGQNKIGTTKRGIGDCYADKYTRIGIRVGDLVDFAIFKEKLKQTLPVKNDQIVKLYGKEPFDYDVLVKEFEQIRELILPRIIDSVVEVNQALDDNKFVLFEGAQAMMLDINYGTYPYVTSSNPTAAGVCTGAGVSPKRIDRIIGVVKAYSSRVGEGPFVTELLDQVGNELREKGGEYGSTTGRPRRIGWLDLNVVRYASLINGLTDIVITKIDILTGLKEIPICVAYDIDGEVVKTIPASLEKMKKAKPIYEYLPGWTEDITNIKEYKELPKACQDYVKRIEELTGCQVSMISVGPDRSQNIFVHELL